MATADQVVQDTQSRAENPESFVSAPEDFLARIGRTAASTFAPAAQSVATLTGQDQAAQDLINLRRSMSVNEPGDILPTNPAQDNSVPSAIAEAIGSAGPRAALISGTGGLAGFGLLSGETLAANQTLIPEQQAQWDLAAQAATTPEELQALGPRPSLTGANTKGVGANLLYAIGGPAAARLAMPLVAGAPLGLRTLAGIGANAATNTLGDIALRTAENAYEGAPLAPYKTPQEAASALTTNTIFGLHGGIEQAAAVPEFLKARAAAKQLAQLQAEAKARADAQAEADKISQAATPQTVTPATGAPDHVVIKTPTEEEPGVSVAPPRTVPPTNPTAELAKANPDATLLPNAAATVASSDTSEAKVIPTPKAEPVEEPKKTEGEPAPPPTDEQRLAAISKQMREIEDSVLGDTSELDAQTKKKYNALSDEAYELRTGQKPEKNVATPVTGLERPDLSKAPPPFTSEEPAPVPVEEPKVTEQRTAPQLSEDLTKLSDDQLAEAEVNAKGNPEAQKLIDDEYDRRATLAANNGEAPEVRTGGPEGDTGVPAGPNVPETNRGTGVPGNEGELGLGRKTADGRDIPAGLTNEEGEEYWKLWDKDKLSKAEDKRLDDLTNKIPSPPNADNSPKSAAETLIRSGRGNIHTVLDKIAKSDSRYADLAGLLRDRYEEILKSAPAEVIPGDRSFYDQSNHKLQVSESQMNDETILHEAIHAITSSAIDEWFSKLVGHPNKVIGQAYIDGLRKIQSSPQVPKPIRDLLGAYFHAKNQIDISNALGGKDSIANRPLDYDRFKHNIPYALITPHEFLAEAFTNRSFQYELNRIPDPRGGSVLTRLFDAVRRILGLPVDQNNLLASVLKHGVDIGDLNRETTLRRAGLIPSAPNEEEKPYLDRGQPPNEPLPEGFETPPGGTVPFKELPPGEGPIGEAPNSRRVLFSERRDNSEELPDGAVRGHGGGSVGPAETPIGRGNGPEAERGGRSGQATGPVGQNAGGKSKTFIENAFDRIKNLPIVSRVAHRLDPAIQDIRDNIVSLFHGKENLSNTAANRVADELRRAIGPNKEDQDAAYHILANGGARIGEQGVPVTPGEDATITADDVKNQIKGEMGDLKAALNNPNIPDARKDVIKKWLPSWQRALDNFDKLLPGAQKAGRAYDDAYELRKSVDPNARYTNDYAARLYELNKERGNSPLPPESFIGNQRNGIQSFNEGRKYQSLSDALIGHQLPNGGWEGETPKSLNLPDLTANHVKVSNDIVGNKMLLDNYETTSYPGTNEPVMIPAPKEGQRLPPNYVRVAGPAGKDVFVYKPVADLFKAIWAPSAVRGSDIGNIALKAAAVAKHGTVAYDIFHPSRLIQKGFFEALAGGKFSEAGSRIADYWRNVVVPSFGNDYIGKHLALLNVDPRDIGEYEQKGYISKETADYLRSPEAQQDRQNIKDGGLLTGRFTDNLWKEAEPWLRKAADTVGLGKAVDAQQAINKFTFERLAPSMMVMAFKNRRAQLEAKFPELSQYQISRQAGKEINEQFGNIGKSGFLKSATAQDLGQIFFLAPSWVQSQVAAEARQYGQLGKAGLEAAYGTKNADGVRERNFRLGNSAKFLATTAASIFALNQAVNLATRGQFTWQNPEKDHKFDAWVPGGKDGFFYSPLTLPSEYAHHMMNYSQYESIPGAATHIAANKLSPLSQAAKVALTQKNYLGQKLTPLQTAGEAAKTLLPVPISLKSPLKAFSEGAKSGTTEQNIARTLGVQLDRAPDAVSQAYQAFQPYRKADSGDHGPSPYKDLRTMVQNGADAQVIKDEVARLNKEGHVTPNIQKSFTAPFHPSGTVKGDLQGLKEHPEYKKLYDAAKAQKDAERVAFMKALQTK